MLNFFKAKFTHITSWLTLEKQSSTCRKLFNSLWAILFGLIVAGFFIVGTKNSFGNNNNMFSVYGAFFSGAATNRESMWMYFSIYAIVAMAIGFAFKSGLFNIGASGQMMLGGMVGVYYLLSRQISASGITPVDVFVSFLICISLAGLAGTLAGALKAFLNVHEVVSTILMNWIFYYIGQHLYRTGGSFTNSTGTSSIQINLSETNSILAVDQFWGIALTIAIVLGIALWVVLQRTVLGYKLKMTGLNSFAAKYAGVSQKTTIIGTMTFSATLAGIAGWLFYVIFNNAFAFGSGPIAEGFDGIAISLLAYNSPIGVLLSSFLYSILRSGAAEVQFQTGLTDESISIISGIIIYFAALSVLFSSFQPVKFFWKTCLLHTNKQFRTIWKQYVRQRFQLEQKHYSQALAFLIQLLFQNKSLMFDWKKPLNLVEAQKALKNSQDKVIATSSWKQRLINSHTLLKWWYLNNLAKNAVDLQALNQMDLNAKLAYFETKQTEKRYIKQLLLRLNYHQLSTMRSSHRTQVKFFQSEYQKQYNYYLNEQTKKFEVGKNRLFSQLTTNLVKLAKAKGDKQ